MKPHITLYILLNDETYRLVHTQGEGLAEIHHTKAELGAAGVAHVTGHSPREGAERGHLSKHAAQILAAEWGKGLYDRIVIAAGPKMLGAFRLDLPHALQGHVAAELHKDLVKVPLHDLPGHFNAVPVV